MAQFLSRLLRRLLGRAAPQSPHNGGGRGGGHANHSDHEGQPYAASVRPAAYSDIPYLLQLIADGAVNGYFHPAFADKGVNQELLSANLHATIQDGLWQKTLRPPSTVGANIYIYEVGARPSGFLMYTEAEPGSSKLEPQEYELYLAAIARAERGEGHGSYMLSEFLKAVPRDWILHARCYPASNLMVEMLQRRGFQLVETTPAGTRVLIRKRESRPAPAA